MGLSTPSAGRRTFANAIGSKRLGRGSVACTRDADSSVLLDLHEVAAECLDMLAIGAPMATEKIV